MVHTIRIVTGKFMDNDSKITITERATLISSIKTPLAFYALALLIGEAGLIAFASKANGISLTIGIVGMILFLFLAMYAVYLLVSSNKISSWDELQNEFCDQVEGSWWERINRKDGSHLSYFLAKRDPRTGDILFQGDGFDAVGSHSATWWSEMTRCYPSDRRIAYLWRGKHPTSNDANKGFHGFGTMQFSSNAGSPDLLQRGGGDFWDVDEYQPDKTVIKSIELRRACADHVKIMESASSDKRRDLVLKIMESW